MGLLISWMAQSEAQGNLILTAPLNVAGEGFSDLIH